MTASSWACAALVCLHLGAVGALPKEVTVQAVVPHLRGDRPVRVLVTDGATKVRLRPQRAVSLAAAETGERIAVAQAGAAISVTASGDGVLATGPGLRVRAPCIRIEPAAADGAVVVSGRGGWCQRGTYRGKVEISPGAGGVRVVEEVPLDSYVAGVVAAEMPSYFPEEAQKAQAIAARTYALYHLGGHAAQRADVCARVHCQAYRGWPGSDSPAAAAARDTAGRVVCWDGLLVDAMYHAACGGTGATAWKVRQGKLLPYLGGRPDTRGGTAYCARGHDVTWARRFTLDEADRLVSSNLGTLLGEPGLRPGTLEGMLLSRDPQTGRAQWLKLYTETGAYRVRGDKVRWIFGTGRPGAKGLPSTAFDLEVEAGADGRPAAFVFTGAGHGHGLGLCQWGARGRAEMGQTAEEILSAYYSCARVVRVGP